MRDVISVRLDDEARRALAELEATGVSRSEAVRHGLVVAAQGCAVCNASSRRSPLAEDEQDRAEAAEVAAVMDDQRALR